MISTKLFGRELTFKRIPDIEKIDIEAGRPPNVPKQETQAYPFFNGYAMGVAQSKIPTPKVTLRALRQLSFSPVPRRAINVIKRQVSSLEWIVVPKPGVEKTPEVERQLRVCNRVLSRPNNSDNFRTFIEMVVEDLLSLDAGVIDKQKSGDPERPMFMWAVDAASIEIYPEWDGAPDQPRYAQNTGYGGNSGQFIDLLDSDLVYLKMNPRTNSPYGISPLEVAYKIIDYFEKSMAYAGKTAGNAIAKKMINLGPSADPDLVKQVEAYIRTMIAGSGRTPVIGGLENATAFDISAPDDQGLYLGWKNFLITLIAVIYDVSPRRLGIQSGSNRSTAESEDSNDMDAAIKPLAKLLAEHINLEIVGELGMGLDSVEFKFILNPSVKAQEIMSNTHYKYGMLGVLTKNQILSDLGKPLDTSEFGKMTYPEMMAKLGHTIGKEQNGDQNRLQNPDSVVTKN